MSESKALSPYMNSRSFPEFYVQCVTKPEGTGS